MSRRQLNELLLAISIVVLQYWEGGTWRQDGSCSPSIAALHDVTCLPWSVTFDQRLGPMSRDFRVCLHLVPVLYVPGNGPPLSPPPASAPAPPSSLLPPPSSSVNCTDI